MMNRIFATALALAMAGGGTNAEPLLLETDEFQHMVQCKTASDAVPVSLIEEGADPRYHDLSFCIKNDKGSPVPMLCKRQWCYKPRAMKVKMPDSDELFGQPKYYVNFFNAKRAQWAELELVTDGGSVYIVTAIGLNDAQWQELQYLP